MIVDQGEMIQGDMIYDSEPMEQDLGEVYY